MIPPRPVVAAPDPDYAQPDFRPSRRPWPRRLRAAVAQGRRRRTLLDGVTGSGKTEVYFEAVAAALDGAGRC